VVTQAPGTPGLPTRGEPNATSPFRLDALLIGAASGNILATPAWPSNSRYAGIVAVNEQGLVTLRGDELALFSHDLRPIKRMTLSSLPSDEYGHDRHWTPRSSWSGKHLLLLGWITWKTGPWLWVDAESLQVLKSWEEVGTGPVAVSDDRLVMSTGGRHFGDPPSTLKVAVPGGDWTPIPSTFNALTPEFVGPSLLYFHRARTINHPGPAEALLIQTDGSEIFRMEATHEERGPGRAAASREGTRFVILETELKGSQPALDIGGHGVLRGFLVYDPPFDTPSYVLRAERSQLRNPDIVALSPDGRHLAILGYPDPQLEVFEIPQVK
jgi:hypothetical protein